MKTNPLVSKRPRQCARFTMCILALAASLMLPVHAFGAFGYTDNGTQFVVDTGAGVVFKVDKANGNVVSWVFNGTEYNGPSGKGSHIASGLGATGTTVSATNLGNIIKVTIQTDAANGVVANFTHYLIVTNGVNNIYMASYATAEPGVGEMRWITRLRATLLPNGPVPSDNTGNIGAIESSDVFGLANGETRSKYYGDGVTHGKDRAMELTYCGATGTGVGVWMVFGNRESSSGGPFFRDIENQYSTSATSDQEIYNYMNSGHNQTEAWRTNVLHGPYVLVWNSGSTPMLPIDTSWLGTLGLTGWVGPSGRGTVSGTASGIPVGTEGVVGLKNSSAQYWATVDGTGSYAISGVKPGTYTATLFQGEKEVATSPVTVTAGTTTTLNLASTWLNPSVVFKLGEWDGTPQGFVNATNILGFSLPNFITMHPQDVRMTPWEKVTFIVGSDPISKFPSIQMRGTNSPVTIKFNLTSGQITNLTLKVGATCAYNGGRPEAVINGVSKGFPGASSQPSSRSWTVGTYRGNNVLWTWTISSANLVVGTNTLTLSPVSGSTDLGPWLSAGWAYDCVELDGPASAPTPPPPPTGLTATPGDAQVALSWTASTGATGYNVKRATVSGGPYTTISSPTTTSYTDTTAANGTTYFYVVSAVNSAGESANSTEASATPSCSLPSVPTGLSATAGDNQVALTWTASSGATSYNVNRSTTSGSGYVTIASPTTASYTDTTAVNGTTYFYVASAVNACGESANSSEVSAAPSSAPPTFVAAGAVASSSSSITPGLPSGVASGDVLLLFVETANETVSISNPNGGTWAEVTGSPQGTGTAGDSSATRLTVFWSRNNGTQGAPTVSDSGNHQIGRMIAIRGAAASGNPWDVTAGAVETTSDTSASIAGATTTVANTLVVVAVGGSLPDANGTANFSGWANADLTGLTESTDNTRSSGNGGALGIATGVKATAGAYGNTAVTHASSAVKGMISIAIKK